MIYLLFGLEKYLIDQKINEIVKDPIYYDLLESNLKDIIDDANEISMFSDKKYIIIDNAYIFTGTKGPNQDTDLLLNYLNNYNENTILVFIVNNDKLDERKKIVKLIREKGKLFDFNNFNTFSIVKKWFNDYKINDNDINYFINRVGNNLYLLKNEAEKVKIYKIDDKTITKTDILNCTNKNIDIDLFKLIDSIINKNIDNSLEIYYEMLKLNKEPIEILVTLANQIRIIYQTKELKLMGYREDDIASLLDVHPYRIKKASEKCHLYNSNILIKYLNDLADLDYKIKTNKIDKELGLELYILSIK